MANITFHQKRYTEMLIVAVVCALAIGACGTIEDKEAASSGSASPDTTDSAVSSGPITIEAANGPVTLEVPATQIAAAQWQFVDTLLNLGVTPTMIADDQVQGGASAVPDIYKSKLGTYTSIGNRTAPNLEVLSSQSLDLILVDKGEHLKDYQQFEKFAPVAVLDTWGWESFYDNIDKLGKLTGKSTEAAKLTDELKTSFSETKSKLSGVAGKKILVTVITKDKIFAFTNNSLQAGAMKELGLNPAYKDVPGVLTEQVSLEQLAELKPDVLFAVANKDAVIVTDGYAGNALWETIPAVKDGKVLRVDRGTWSLGRGPTAVHAIIDETASLLGQ